MYRSVASFRCNEGYLLDGVRSIECQANEQWSNNVPTCSRIGKIISSAGVGKYGGGILHSFMVAICGWRIQGLLSPSIYIKA